MQKHWPASVQWIEGGLGGLNLSPHFDTHESIIILDYMPKLNNATMLPLSDVLKKQTTVYDHASALYYLLHSLPILYDSLPNIQCLACCPDSNDWQQHIFDTLHHHIEQYEEAA